ncbi:MAG: hypothetical protein QM811_02010 [Pirellulales bacterium]
MLALLALTALVALGVKLWQGPHRAESPIDADPAAEGLLHWWGPLTDGATVSYDYVNTPGGRRRGPAVVTGGVYRIEVLAKTSDAPTAQKALPVLRTPLNPHGDYPHGEPAQDFEVIHATVLDLDDPDRKHVYLLSDRGRVYRLIEVSSYFGLLVAQTHPDSILGSADARSRRTRTGKAFEHGPLVSVRLFHVKQFVGAAVPHDPTTEAPVDCPAQPGRQRSRLARVRGIVSRETIGDRTACDFW